MHIDSDPDDARILQSAKRFWDLSGERILDIERAWDPSAGAPVFTVDGRYAARGWTDWTRGFQYGSSLLQFEATGDRRFLDIGSSGTHAHMSRHLTHRGVHDHGFNIVSTYGALLRMVRQGIAGTGDVDAGLCEQALKVSGAVQASRWASTDDGGGYVYSFNGPHSLFADTIRSMRSLAIADILGHVLYDEQDAVVSLFDRVCAHLHTTVTRNVYYGRGRDAYDTPGRVAHESVFNPDNGSYRGPASQQGYSAYSTWMRGLSWIMLGCAELLEYLAEESLHGTARKRTRSLAIEEADVACRATCEFYLAHTPVDGVPYWDSDAPGLRQIESWRDLPADPFNRHEPVDSSAAAIAAQAFLRFGRYLSSRRDGDGDRYVRAGMQLLGVLTSEPYLSTEASHQGILLHGVYHRPNGWDHVRNGQAVPNGESCMWGDYHVREAMLLAGRMLRDDVPAYPAFYEVVEA